MTHEAKLKPSMAGPIIEVSVVSVVSAVGSQLRDHLNTIPEQNTLIKNQQGVVLRKEYTIGYEQYNALVKECLKTQLHTVYNSFHHQEPDFYELVSAQTCIQVLGVPEDQARSIMLGYTELFEAEEEAQLQRE